MSAYRRITRKATIASCTVISLITLIFQLKTLTLLNGNAPDIDAECRQYEEKSVLTVKSTCLWAVGNDGHIAFNEPASSLASRTRIKTLTSTRHAANSRF